MMRRRNVQHGQARRHVSMFEVGCLGVLSAVANSAFMLMRAPSFGGG
ncbi:hypothetical protein PQI51_03145 [Microbacterium esteraromaticum]